MKKPNKKVTDKIKDVFHGKTRYVSCSKVFGDKHTLKIFKSQYARNSLIMPRVLFHVELLCFGQAGLANCICYSSYASQSLLTR
jgi:hypothetical protein